MQELWIWIERIGTCLASLLQLELVLIYMPIVFRLLLRLLKAIWQMPARPASQSLGLPATLE